MIKIKIYKGKDKQWYWQMKAKNGEIIADGAQGYKTKQACKKGVDRLLEMIQYD